MNDVTLRVEWPRFDLGQGQGQGFFSRPYLNQLWGPHSFLSNERLRQSGWRLKLTAILRLMLRPGMCAVIQGGAEEMHVFHVKITLLIFKIKTF